MNEIVLLPIRKPLSQTLGDYLRAQVPEVLGMPVTIRLVAAVPPPGVALDLERNQYIGPGMLKFLSELDIPRALRLVGLLAADAYAPGLNFCFGQAAFHGREAFVALPRLRTAQYFDPLPVREDIFLKRVLKEVVHELGHTFGLRHCTHRCVMRFSNSLVDVDKKPAEFCEVCRRALPGGFAPPPP